MATSTNQRDPVLDKCDEEIAAILKKYNKAIRPVPFINQEGRIEAQIVYFDVPVPQAQETEPQTESPLQV